MIFDHTIHLTAEDSHLFGLSLIPKQKHLTSKRAGHPIFNLHVCFHLLLPALGWDFARLEHG